ncbi:aldose 1-epimerase [Luteibacter rhizovicinus]|uniref:Aldose 1-epimerase n=1 Tax=Luteibacter rhizovicinus TaxID=242606 RepID=A0A4R3YQK9_9GAMM|nr:aldose 1-epimerase [Luteibacter rhizovicinus]TCV94691.1 aldose 1-epimerase [Luteibacter rhizovicinus]
MLHLKNARLSVRVLPEAGGSLAGFDWCGRAESIPLMLPYDPLLAAPEGQLDPNQLACYPLLPWGNRISGGGFEVAGRRVSLSPNRDDEPLPIHGSGWQRVWQPVRHSEHEVVLELTETTPDAYSYRASMHYALRDDTLQVDLRVTNIGSSVMPFGLGLHPFFPRHGAVELLAPASKVWVNDGHSPLPVALVDVPTAWDFNRNRALPAEGLNHCFRPWTGSAVISWPREGLRLHVEADVDAFVLYTPADQEFFCFEPVDHAINAVHLPGGAVANGMTLLAPQASLARRFVFRAVDDDLV